MEERRTPLEFSRLVGYIRDKALQSDVALTIASVTQSSLAVTASNTNAGAAAITYTVNSGGVITP